MNQKSYPLKPWLTTIFVGLIFLVAIFLRTFRLKETLQFLGDEGRDATIVSQIFLKHDPVFIGPVTSVGNMYLGPFYYYFMLPFLRLSFPSPMGPVWAVAILGILTVILLYLLGKKMFNQKVALIAVFFYTFSATVITQTRFSWNPNPAPFVSLLMIWYIYQAQKQPKKWIIVMILMSIIIQLHYLALLAVASGGVIWLIQLIQYLIHRKESINQLKQFFVSTLLGVLIFILSFTPLVLFDIKHDFLNTKSLQYLLTKEENFSHSTNLPLGTKVWETFRGMEGRAMHILFETNIGKERQLNAFLVILVVLVLGLSLATEYFSKKPKTITAQQIIAVFFVVGVSGTAIYQHTIFDHYVAYLFPVTAFIYGLVIKYLLSDLPKLGAWPWFRSLLALKKILACLFIFAFTIYFLQYNFENYYYEKLEWTVDDMANLATAIKQALPEDQAYSLVLVGPSKDYYAQNYRYFLTSQGRPPIDPLYNDQASYLVLILEDEANFDLQTSLVHEIEPFKAATSVDNFKIGLGPRIIILRK